MSALREMADSLAVRKQAIASLKAANAVFRERFPVGSRVEFDRGDMRLIGGLVLDVCDDQAAIKPDTTDIGPWLTVVKGVVYVPWALLFTLQAAAEMHAVRDDLITTP